MSVVTSADKAYKYFKELGYEWTRAEVREAWKTVGEKDMWATVIKTYGTDRPIPRAWIIEKKGGLEPGYQMTIKMTYMDANTGEVETRYISQIYDRPVSYDQAFSDVSDYLEEYKVALGQIPIELSPGGVFHLSGPGR
jgi:hypothetical protein